MNKAMKMSALFILGAMALACNKEEIQEEATNSEVDKNRSEGVEATIENAGELHNDGLVYIFNDYLAQKAELEEEITIPQVIEFIDNSMQAYLVANDFGDELEAIDGIADDLLMPCYAYEFQYCEESIYDGYSETKTNIIKDMSDLIRDEGTIAVTVAGLEDLKTQANEELTEAEKPAVIGGLNVAISSYTYWTNNRLDWKDEIPGSPADAELSPYVATMDAIGFMKGYEYYGNVWGGVYGAVLLSTKAAEIERLHDEIDNL